MIISRTPFRISFFGGGTDYPAWYREHGGAVLATTIDKYCYLTCRYLPPFFEHRLRVVYSKIENCQTIDEIQHPAAREVLRSRSEHRSPGLTERELDVLGLVRTGLSNKLIAHRLEISEKTVKAHLTSIFQRIGVTDRTQAALWAERHGIGR